MMPNHRSWRVGIRDQAFCRPKAREQMQPTSATVESISRENKCHSVKGMNPRLSLAAWCNVAKRLVIYNTIANSAHFRLRMRTW